MIVYVFLKIIYEWQMLGTILTYELVLLQFAESTKETDDEIESAESGC